jgi:hypothetical protein
VAGTDVADQHFADLHIDRQRIFDRHLWTHFIN